ncbi:MAG TPA: ABC transporter substrate-binding protein [Candidatus Binatia bacterium]|nr:ABC transporter substrate-binding protein [Candidatus Binatia bacterium]
MKTKVTVLTVIAMLFALSSVAEAQKPKKIYHMGILISASPSIASRRIQAFQQALRDLGYIEGKNMIIEYRYAEGKLEPLADLAKELVRLKVDIIVTDTSMATQAAKNATKTIPVVFTAANDPVGDGQVASLARPGGNLTGFSLLAPELNEKRLELLKDSVSNVTRAAFLTRSSTPTGERRFKEAEVAAKGLGLRLQLLQAKHAEDLESAFDAAKRSGVQAVLAHPSSFIVSNQARIIELAAKHRLPVIYHRSALAEAGGLMSYGPGPDIVDNYRRAAVYVDKILKGTKPADLPVQQPTKFELVINLKSARQIGLTIPPNVLARADRVIR